MIGTPNLGAVNAYYFWSGGKLPYSKVEDNILYNGLKLGFMLYYHLFKDINHIEDLRGIFPIVKDLLPSYGYGNYLFHEEAGIRKEIPVENMSIENEFLNELDRKTIHPGKLYIIGGKGVFTNKEYLVDIKNRGKIKWKDGKPIKAYRTNYGDGTVTTFSTLGHLGGENIVLEGNHTDILYRSKDYLSSILEKPIVSHVQEERIEKAYIIFIEGCDKIDIRTSQISEISSKDIDIIDDRIQAIKLSNNKFWILVTGDEDLEVELDVKPIGKVKPKIYKKIIDKKNI